MNTQICAHEIAGAAQAYGLRNDLTDSFWNKQFVVGSEYQFSAATLDVGDSVQFSAGNWHLDRGGSTSGSYNWSSSNPGVASVSGTGLVIAVSPGTDTVRAKPTASSSYLFTLDFLRNGTWTVVTVDSEPPANINNITSITRSGSNGQPIYQLGNYTLTAHMGPGDTTGISFQWTIIFSNSPGDSTVSPPTSASPWGPPTHVITVPAPIGSYTITARARARRDSTIALVNTTQDFPVCPAPPGQEFIRMDSDTTFGTDTVAGC